MNGKLALFLLKAQMRQPESEIVIRRLLVEINFTIESEVDILIVGQHFAFENLVSELSVDRYIPIRVFPECDIVD